MTQQFDIVILGDSDVGKKVVNTLASASQSINIAFISKTFKSNTTHDHINVEYIQDEVLFTDYKNRLFGCYLKTGKRIYCTHLIIATGLLYKTFTVNGRTVPNVYNNTSDIQKKAKTLPAIVIGDTNEAIKLALDVSKKFKQVYICTPSMQLNGAKATVEKLLAKTNIAVLPNTSINKVHCKQGVLESVELDNYSAIMCSAIFVKTDSCPEVKAISEKLISRTDSNYLKVSSNCESLLVPNCFAVGNCVEKFTRTMLTNMLSKILKDFI